ncbi:hypothetical protein FACS1894219_01470 [Clostridia bacterium]|nr:hypothetical protein FACS1894219_01470 [Clostridia bacterium]
MKGIGKKTLINLIWDTGKSVDFALVLDSVDEKSVSPINCFNCAFIGDGGKTEFLAVLSECSNTDINDVIEPDTPPTPRVLNLSELDGWNDAVLAERYVRNTETEDLHGDVTIFINAPNETFARESAAEILRILVKARDDGADDVKLISFGESAVFDILQSGEFAERIDVGSVKECESYFTRGNDNTAVKSIAPSRFVYRALTTSDERLYYTMRDNHDSYLLENLDVMVVRAIYDDCGLIGCFDGNEFIGYISFYEICDALRDVSYVFVMNEYRQKGIAADMLNFFIENNAAAKKLTYYSYAESEASRKLSLHCGMKRCALRTEAYIKLKETKPAE